jgi:hypothetical protein
MSAEKAALSSFVPRHTVAAVAPLGNLLTQRPEVLQTLLLLSLSVVCRRLLCAALRRFLRERRAYDVRCQRLENLCIGAALGIGAGCGWAVFHQPIAVVLSTLWFAFMAFGVGLEATNES